MPGRLVSPLLVMLKPDGAARTCSHDDVKSIIGAWADLLAWLNGHDFDDLHHRHLVRAVAHKAALHMVRFPEYDIRTWMSQAPHLITPTAAGTSDTQLQDVISELVRSLGFRHEQSIDGWLNRVTIELIYRDSPQFDANRELLIPRLLAGPVVIQFWRGNRRELAHAIKLLIRSALSMSEITNLIHIESVSEQEIDLIRKSLCVEP
ncbi:MAG: hypothetical protein ACRDSZ_05885 [Pseudonocardiaceae bacterium]